MKTALIYDQITPGGGSWVEAEYESPETIRALLAALEENFGQAVGVPFGPDMIDTLKREAPDCVLNIAEGREGPSRESIVPAVLDHLCIPYAGADAAALGISLNKAVTKHVAAGAGIPTPDFALCGSRADAVDAAERLRFPVLAKPNFGGSSVGVGPESVIREPAHLAPAVEASLHEFDQPCLVEEFVRGTDVTVGLLGNEPVEAFPIGRILAMDGMYSAAAKQAHDRRIDCPCSLPAGMAEQLRDWSVRIFKLTGARDFARVDYMMDTAGKAWFLEINPLPGLSPYYGVLPVLAAAAGYAHTELIGAIMRSAMQRRSFARSSVYEGLAR